MTTHVLFIIDTNEFAGNFERELVGYITGHVGECGVGDEYAGMFQEDVDPVMQTAISNIVAQVDFEDDGCLRPAMIWETPGRVNNGRGFNYDDTPENRLTHGGGYPAYESVAAAFEERPSPEMIELMKQRAHEFMNVHEWDRWSQKRQKPIPPTITGFRLVTREVIVTKTSSENEERV